LPRHLIPDGQERLLGFGPRYRAAKNRVTALVRRDNEASNLDKLTESGNLPTVLWKIANAAVGKPCKPLPTLVMRADGTTTEGNLEAANAVNAYYVEKVLIFGLGGESKH
jgi:hypothetical protein